MKPLLEMQTLHEALGKLPNASLAAARRAALAQVERNGLPGTRHEDWKYTDLAPVIEISNEWAKIVAAGGHWPTVAPEDIFAVTSQLDIDWIVLRNGTIDSDSLNHLERVGVTVRLLSDDEAIPDLAGAMSEFNAAMLSDGLLISISKDCDSERAVGLLHIDSTSEEVGVSQTRIVIDVAEDCAASFVEYHSSTGAAAHYANSVLQCALGPRARVNYVRVQDRAPAHSQTGSLQARLAADSEFNHAAFDFGGQLVRNDLDLKIDGPNAHATFSGLYLADGSQHIDNHTRVDHKVGPARSDQEYRGILADAARCVWNGKAVVHAGADGTDANQANHNLLLSERSEIDAKPELEIYADDVKCSHGTTVGQLDKTALFYLQTRGIDEANARQLLTRAFAQQIVETAPIDAVKQLLGDLVAGKLERLVAGGAT